MHPSDIIERAFELARQSTTIEEVRNALRREGYSNVDAHLAGPTIKADLKRLFPA
jgi:tRNA G26 N,N-dimethylase Trm1